MSFPLASSSPQLNPVIPMQNNLQERKEKDRKKNSSDILKFAQELFSKLFDKVQEYKVVISYHRTPVTLRQCRTILDEAILASKSLYQAIEIHETDISIARKSCYLIILLKRQSECTNHRSYIQDELNIKEREAFIAWQKASSIYNKSKIDLLTLLNESNQHSNFSSHESFQIDKEKIHRLLLLKEQAAKAAEFFQNEILKNYELDDPKVIEDLKDIEATNELLKEIAEIQKKETHDNQSIGK